MVFTGPVAIYRSQMNDGLEIRGVIGEYTISAQGTDRWAQSAECGRGAGALAQDRDENVGVANSAGASTPQARLTRPWNTGVH